ncbi:MAG: site-2 protease family protein [Geminicoccaceae bacterium]
MDLISQITGYVIPFLVILSVVVFVHEYGHYWVARRNGIRVETFSIGFGQELFGFNDRHGTRWKFSWIPLGGYVKMLGDADATSATADAETSNDPDSFPAKTVWQRMAVVVAGPAANIIFAIVGLAALVMMSGRPLPPSSPMFVMAARQPWPGWSLTTGLSLSMETRSRVSRNCRSMSVLRRKSR